MKQIHLIFGAAGFIGTNLVNYLKFNDDNTNFILVDKRRICNTIIDDKNFINVTKRECLDQCLENKDYSFIFDLCNLDNLNEFILDPISLILNNIKEEFSLNIWWLPSIVGVNNFSDENSINYNKAYYKLKLQKLLNEAGINSLNFFINVKQTDAIKNFSNIKFNFTSTSELYGNIAKNSPAYLYTDYIMEYISIDNFKGIRNQYVLSKLMMEMELKNIQELLDDDLSKDITINIFRLFNIFGVHQDDEKGIVAKTIHQLLNSESNILHFDYSTAKRTYTDLISLFEGFMNSSNYLVKPVVLAYSKDDNAINGYHLIEKICKYYLFIRYMVSESNFDSTEFEKIFEKCKWNESDPNINLAMLLHNILYEYFKKDECSIELSEKKFIFNKLYSFFLNNEKTGDILNLQINENYLDTKIVSYKNENSNKNILDINELNLSDIKYFHFNHITIKDEISDRSIYGVQNTNLKQFDNSLFITILLEILKKDINES